jgi:PAS domain S-box-containing protein
MHEPDNEAGDLDELVSAKDWSQTPLGPFSSWSPALRNTVSLCLAANFPMSVVWGPGLVLLYNERYRQHVCAEKHPRSLGQNYRECWESAWPVLGPLFDRALAGKSAFLENQRMFIDRNGYLEETFFTFSFSPIRDEEGKVGGVLNPCTNTTADMLNERRTRSLRDFAIRAANAATRAEAWELIARTLGSYDLDLPFVLLYRLDEKGRTLQLVSSAGVGPPFREKWGEHRLDEPSPFEEVVRTGQPVVVDVAECCGELEAGPYPEAPRQAVALPITPPGHKVPAAILLAGVSARRGLDDAYRAFYDLLGAAVTTAVANAIAREEEVQRREALAAIDRAKTTFFSNVSHEFRTPLTLMIGPTEDALGSKERVLRGADLETVHRNELRLLKLVNMLLDFSRIEAGRVQASYQPTDLSALTIDLASTFRSAIERGGLRLDVDCPPLSQPVFVDPEMWEKIVLNLLSNAFKFTFEGTIRVALRESSSGVELEVSDTGIGIAPPDLSRVFERFHRIEGSRSRTHEGSGIGLALVNDLVRLSGGKIAVSSELENGTTFWVSLPFGSAHLPADRIGAGSSKAVPEQHAGPYVQEALRWLPSSPQTPVDSAPVGPPVPVCVNRDARILIADDNADMRDYLARLLGQIWSVETVGDGAQALARARQQPPDVILTDVMMPVLDGFELLRQVRGDPRTEGVKVIMVSARAGEESRIEGLDAGADDYLVKPFGARELVARVNSQLGLALAARERKQLLEREQTARKEADLQQQRLIALVSQAPTPIAMLKGPTHVIELANPAVARIWGRTPEELTGRPLLVAMPELHGQSYMPLLDQVYRTGETHHGKETAAMLARGTGALEQVFFNYSYVALRDVHGEIEGVLVIAYDVTDEVRAREQMAELRAAAEAANRSKDEFLAMLGHELRNPLAPIRTSLELIRKRLPRSPVERQVEVIERQSKNLARIVDDLLEVSRIRLGKIELRKERLDLGKAISRALDAERGSIEARKHDVSVSLPMRPVEVVADAVRIDQVLVNLLTNAVKYTDAGGRIWVSLEVRDDRAELRVRDNGMGISSDLRSRLFGLFEQGSRDLSRNQGGLGIGLTIVHRLVELHGGEVDVKSDGAGKGSEFVVRLPLAPEDRVIREAGVEAVTPKPAGTIRVLIVDDNQDAAEAMLELATELGHEANVAFDGPTALEICDRCLPDLVFLDIGLPGMDGYEVARALKERHATVPALVALTGYSQASDREKAREAGFKHHLAKPASLEAIEDLLQTTGRELQSHQR